MPLDPEIAAEIAEARRILREDKILSGQKAIHEKLSKHFPDEPSPGNPEPPTGVPPAPDPKDPPQPQKKKGAWWGDQLDS